MENPATIEPESKRGRRKRMPRWADAIPLDLNLDDDLEVIATLGFRSLAVTLVKVLADPFLPLPKRVQLVSQINAQLNATKSMRRLWLAEQVLKGNERAIAETSRGRELELAPDAEGTDSSQQVGRPTARQGRPRKR